MFCLASGGLCACRGWACGRSPGGGVKGLGRCLCRAWAVWPRHQAIAMFFAFPILAGHTKTACFACGRGRALPGAGASRPDAPGMRQDVARGVRASHPARALVPQTVWPASSAGHGQRIGAVAWSQAAHAGGQWAVRWPRLADAKDGLVRAEAAGMVGAAVSPGRVCSPALPGAGSASRLPGDCYVFRTAHPCWRCEDRMFCLAAGGLCACRGWAGGRPPGGGVKGLGRCLHRAWVEWPRHQATAMFFALPTLAGCAKTACFACGPGACVAGRWCARGGLGQCRRPGMRAGAVARGGLRVYMLAARACGACMRGRKKGAGWRRRRTGLGLRRAGLQGGPALRAGAGGRGGAMVRGGVASGAVRAGGR